MLTIDVIFLHIIVTDVVVIFVILPLLIIVVVFFVVVAIVHIVLKNFIINQCICVWKTNRAQRVNNLLSCKYTVRFTCSTQWKANDKLHNLFPISTFMHLINIITINVSITFCDIVMFVFIIVVVMTDVVK